MKFQCGAKVCGGVAEVEILPWVFDRQLTLPRSATRNTENEFFVS